MTWARQRQVFIIGIIAVFLLILSAAIWALFFRAAPSCMDGKQSGKEEGIDCGGSCTYLCRASLQNPEPIIKFVRTVSPFPGRTDVIAYIDNANSNAAVDGAEFTLYVYDNQNAVIGLRKGIIDLLPGVTTPLFFPGAVVGDIRATRAFLTIDSASLHWISSAPVEEATRAENVSYQAGESPRVTASVRNLTVEQLGRTSFVATLFSDDGTVLASSATVVENVPARGTADVVFTWPTSINGVVARVEILPVLSLPTP